MFQSIVDECRLRNYSPKTIKAYLYYNRKFLLFCGKRPQEVTNQDIKGYLLSLISKERSSSQINLAHNAINFYFKNILKRNFSKIPFQKRENRVKDILSRQDIQKLIHNIKNRKHRLMISLLYASGIRVSELVKVKLQHLDFENKRLLVKQGKGKKDRFTLLSDRLIVELRTYLGQSRVKNYLFPGRIGHLSVRTVQEIIKQAARKAKIFVLVTPHRLRHSFATHLLEAGIKDGQLQRLLGHEDIRTTQTYARVANKHLVGIKSPHDEL